MKNIDLILPNSIINGGAIEWDEETGCITTVLAHKSLPMSTDAIDGKRNWLFPGFIDIHVHFRDFNHSHKETYQSGSNAALKGGITTIFDMPNKIPPLDTQKRLNNAIQQSKKSNIDIFTFALLTELSIKEDMFWKYGKIYFGGSTAAQDTPYKILKKIPDSTALIISCHAEDGSIIRENLKCFDPKNVYQHNQIRDPQAEVTAVKNVLTLLKDMKFQQTKFHIAHVSVPNTINILNNNSLSLSFEVTPHHMFLNTNDLVKLGELGRVNPPLRDKNDMLQIRNSWEQGLIPIVASDHAPHTLEEKENNYVSGIPELDTAFRVLIDHCLRKTISPSLIARTYSYNPAQRMNITDRGHLKSGLMADLVLVDPNMKEKIISDHLETKCGWSPWENQELKGIPLVTWKRGIPKWFHPNINSESF
ncbi:MAG: dihydroorotase [Candidatus Hodarchaeales archaeon]